MSAFIVENKTINRIISGIQLNRNGLDTRIKNIWGYDVNDPQDCERLGKELLMLNIQSVNYRYEEDRTGTKELTDYSYKKELLSNVQALKSTKCLRYQCDEGNIPETELYKLLEFVINWLSDEIINSMPIYEKSDWG